MSGSLSYLNDANVSAPGFTIVQDQFGVSRIIGSGQIPSKSGSGTATVSVELNRFLWWSFATISVNDAAAGINNLNAYSVFAPVPSVVNGSATIDGDWFVWQDFQVKPYHIQLQVTDGVTPS